jgi:hypothetical protein
MVYPIGLATLTIQRMVYQDKHVLREPLTIQLSYVSPASNESAESVKVSHAVDTRKLTRAREGRGLRGLGLPVDEACITNDVAHAGGTSLGPRGSAPAVRPAVGNESGTNGAGFGLVQDDTAHAEPRW